MIARSRRIVLAFVLASVSTLCAQTSDFQVYRGTQVPPEVERIYEKVGFSKKETTEIVESIFEVVKRRLEQGEKVKVSGFGNFVVNEKRPRKGRNPQTGEEIIITCRRVLTFKASQVLKKTMNDGVEPVIEPEHSEDETVG